MLTPEERKNLKSELSKNLTDLKIDAIGSKAHADELQYKQSALYLQSVIVNAAECLSILAILRVDRAERRASRKRVRRQKAN